MFHKKESWENEKRMNLNNIDKRVRCLHIVNVSGYWRSFVTSIISSSNNNRHKTTEKRVFQFLYLHLKLCKCIHKHVLCINFNFDSNVGLLSNLNYVNYKMNSMCTAVRAFTWFKYAQQVYCVVQLNINLYIDIYVP